MAGINALASRSAGYAVAAKCLEVQKQAELADASLRTSRSVRLAEDARSWYVGALGEIEVGRMLEALGPEWFVRHAVPIGTGTKDVDHLVIGPAGVFAINTKHHANAAVWIGDYIVKVNGAQHRHVKQAWSDGSDVSRRISQKVGFPVLVTAVVNFLNPASLKDGRAQNRTVVTLEARQLVTWLKAQQRRLGETELNLIRMAAEEPDTWHVDPRAADTVRVMQRWERLVSDVGPVSAPSRKSVSSRPARSRRQPNPRPSSTTARKPRRSGADLVKLWFSIGVVFAAILLVRNLANQPCDGPVACIIPTLYMALRPLLMLLAVAGVAMGVLGSIVWLARGTR
jgi:hypothetical protein